MCLLISIPVIAVTASGIVFMMFRISVVILEGPTLPGIEQIGIMSSDELLMTKLPRKTLSFL